MSNADEKALPAIAVGVPLMSLEAFAARSGVEFGVVRGWVDKGYLPTVKLGRHRLVNVEKVVEKCRGE